MDFLKNAVGGNAENTNTGTTAQGTQPLGGQQQQGGGMMDKMNSALGGGQASEKNEGASSHPPILYTLAGLTHATTYHLP